MTKLVMAVILLLIGALVAGAYFDFNPTILIFVILGFGIYMVRRIGGPQLPEGTHVSFGDTYGVYLHREDFVPPDTDLNWRKDKEAAVERETVRASGSGGTLRDGVDQSTPRRRVNRTP